MSVKKVNWVLVNENYGANLAPYIFHFDADYYGFKKIFGRGINYQSIGVENGLLRQGYDKDEFADYGDFIFEVFKNNRLLVRKMHKKVYQITDDFHKFNKEVCKLNLNNLSNRKLAKLFDKFYNFFFEMSAWSVPFGFSEHGNPRWTDSLTAYLLGLGMPAGKVATNYQFLTSNEKDTYAFKEKRDSLKMAQIIKKSTKLKKIFNLKADQVLPELRIKDIALFRKIKQHTKKYNWINFGFEGPLLDEEYFVSYIKDCLENKNIEQELQEDEKRKFLPTLQDRILNDWSVDREHRWMFWVVKEFGFQKAYRKDIEYFSYYTYDILLKELGRRFNITSQQGHYLLKNEIIDALLKGKTISSDILNQRIKACFYLVIKGKTRLITGRECWKFTKKIKSESIPKNITELSGQCACSGKVDGVIKIIKNKEDYAKFNRGDILVSYATNPNMVPLMKQASAIITDQGGITCHAAIVSRELGTPCVIGTKFATKVLKDNTKVKVDANKGIIKIIK